MPRCRGVRVPGFAPLALLHIVRIHVRHVSVRTKLSSHKQPSMSALRAGASTSNTQPHCSESGAVTCSVAFGPAAQVHRHHPPSMRLSCVSCNATGSGRQCAPWPCRMIIVAVDGPPTRCGRLSGARRAGSARVSVLRRTRQRPSSTSCAAAGNGAAPATSPAPIIVRIATLSRPVCC